MMNDKQWKEQPINEEERKPIRWSWDEGTDFDDEYHDKLIEEEMED